MSAAAAEHSSTASSTHLAVERGASPNTVRAYAADLAALPRVGRARGRRPDHADPPPAAPLPRRARPRAVRAPHHRPAPLGGALLLRATSSTEGVVDSDPVGGARDAQAPVAAAPARARPTRSRPCSTRPTRRRRRACATARSSSCSTRPALRVSEVAGLDLGRRSTSRRARSRVMGKGSKERIVPIHRLAVEQLRDVPARRAARARARATQRRRASSSQPRGHAAVAPTPIRRMLQPLPRDSRRARVAVAARAAAHVRHAPPRGRARTCAPCRSCSVTLRCLPPRFILT